MERCGNGGRMAGLTHNSWCGRICGSWLILFRASSRVTRYSTKIRLSSRYSGAL